MYKLRSRHEVKGELLKKYPGAKDAIPLDMLIGIAKTMHEKNMIRVSESTIMRDPNWREKEDKEYVLTAYVMTTKEFMDAIELIALMNKLATPQMKDLINQLYKIMTQEPTP